MVFFVSSFQRRVLFISLCIGELILQGSSDQRLLSFILLPKTGDYPPVLTYLPRVSILLSCYIFSIDYRRLFSNGRGDVLRHSLIGINTGCVFNALPSHTPPAEVSENLIPVRLGRDIIYIR